MTATGTRPGEIPFWSEDALTARAKAVWTAGDYHPVARSFANGAGEFVDRLRLRRGEWVLDAACGTGNLTLPAACTGANVTGIDLAPTLIAQARIGARHAGCTIHYDIGNVEELPYATDQFDTVMSMFGAMFAYRPDAVARELARVTRRGGRIALANWTPDGFVGAMLRAHVAALPHASGTPSPLEWGVESLVRDRLGGYTSAITCTVRTIEITFPCAPAEVVEIFATSYGPTVTTLRAAEPDRGARLREVLTDLFTRANIAEPGHTTVVGEYLEVLAIVD
ncbi:MAG TPA: class I SAM-dependent methyltransferase [Gemmatimonadales bacterium]|nr:class I SAM-dependent methyltransferase [Gemmatimonadales bacterium]